MATLSDRDDDASSRISKKPEGSGVMNGNFDLKKF